MIHIVTTRIGADLEGADKRSYRRNSRLITLCNVSCGKCAQAGTRWTFYPALVNRRAALLYLKGGDL